jgi:anaerobic selenocysteine-containing dehydrogenase
MDRRRFLVIAAAASAAGSAGTAPRAVFAATHVARVSVIRWPREMLYGVPGRCAGMRTGTGFDLERMLSTR